MYPAGGGVNVRKAYRDTTLGGYSVPVNTDITTSTLLTQKDSRYWKEPEKFNPDRWNEAGIPVPGSWTVFGGGARGCPGNQFALLSGSVTMAHMVRNFVIENEESHPPEMGFALFATFKTDVKVKLTARNPGHDEL